MTRPYSVPIEVEQVFNHLLLKAMENRYGKPKRPMELDMTIPYHNPTSSTSLYDLEKNSDSPIKRSGSS